MIELFNNINNGLCSFLHINSYVQGVVVLLCINIIAILGMAVLTGFTRLFSFGNAGFMAIGAYTAAILIVRHNFNFLIAMLIGAAFAGFIAFLLGSLTLKLKGDYFLFKKLTGGSAGFPGIPNYSSMTFAVICAVLAFFIAWRFIHSKFGRNLTSIRENELAAEAVGINAFRYKRLSFTFSAVYAGWAGALYAGYMMYIVPTNFALNKSIELITTTVIGGLGSLTGSVLGAMLVTLLPEVFRSLSNYRMLIYGFAVVLIIMFRPNGLYGYKEFSLKRTIAWFKKLFSGSAKAGKEEA